MLQYLQSSKTFFKKLIIVVKRAPSSQGCARAIWKLNHYIYFQLINFHPTVVANRWRYNTLQNWELLANSYNNISDGLIHDAKLLWLNLYILALGYLEKRALRFTKLSTEDKGEKEDHQVKPQVPNLKEKKNKQKTIQKEKKESRVAACLTTLPPSVCEFPKPGPLKSSGSSASATPPSALSTLFALSTLSTLSIPSAPSAPFTLSALSAPFALFVPSA